MRGLIRRAEQTEHLKSVGVTAVVGSLDDKELLTREAQAADVVINAASSDHRAAVETILEALRVCANRMAADSLLLSGFRQNFYSYERLVDRRRCGRRRAWRGARFHRGHAGRAAASQTRASGDRFACARGWANVVAVGWQRDASLAAPHTHGPLRTAIMCPCLIYGHGKVQGSASVQLPRLVDEARRTGIAKHIGSGQNIWSNVHVDDVAAAYRLVLEKSPAHQGVFYFLDSGSEASFHDMAQAIATALKLPPPQALPLENAKEIWGAGLAEFTLASNSRIRGKRARDLGWTPKHTDLLAWIKAEIH